MGSDARLITVHRVRARAPWLVGMVASIVLPLIGLGVLVSFAPLVAALFAGFWHWFLALIALLAWTSWKRAHKLDVERRPRMARATDEGLFIEGGSLLPRGLIAAAYVSPSWPNGAYVRVLRRGAWPVELWTADVEGAHGLVASLGLDEEHVVGVVSGSARISRRATSVVSLFVVLALSIGLTIAWKPLFLLFPLFVLAWVILSFVPVEHVVGTDGVLTRWLGRRLAFVPIGEILAADAEPGRVVLRKRDGGTHDLLIARDIGGAADGIGLQVSLLAERVRRAMRHAGTLEIDASVLERGGRELPGWLSSLRELANGSGYRAAVQREDLVYLVEDARRDPKVRIAAAVALGKTDAHERARVRIAASSSSIPEVREALEGALDSDDERVSSALMRLDEG